MSQLRLSSSHAQRDISIHRGSASAQAGFKPEYFARLAAIEQAHFWFRARNALIQWALGKYFPNAESFFEIGCGTGYVLGGIRENFPRMRLVGSDIFTDGLIFAKARLPGWSCIRWMHDGFRLSANLMS